MTPSVRLLCAGAIAFLLALAPARGRAEDPPPPGLEAPSARGAGADGPEIRYPELVLAPTTSALAGAERVPDSDLELRLLPLESRADPVGAALALVPGGSAGADGPRLRGGSAIDLATFVDGFRVYDVRPPAGLLARAEVLATGYGVALGHVPGGAVALTTRRARRLEVGGAVFRQENPAFEPDRYGGGRYLVDQTTDGLSAGFATPIVDHLGLVAAVTRQSSERPGHPDFQAIVPTPPPQTERRLDTGGALVGRLADGHEVTLLGLVTTLEDRPTLLEREPAAQMNEQGRSWFAGAGYRGQTGRWSFDTRASLEHARTTVEPQLCRDKPEQCDQVTPRLLVYPYRFVRDNGERRERLDERRIGLSGSLAAEFGADPRVSHRTRITAHLEQARRGRETAIPGGSIETWNGLNHPESRSTGYKTDPRLGPAEVGGATTAVDARQMLLALEHEVHFADRATIVPGVGVVWAHAEGGGDSVIASAREPVLQLTATGKVSDQTSVGASAARRVSASIDGQALALHDTQITQRCLWDANTQEFTRDCTVDGGPGRRTVGLPCGTSGFNPDGTYCHRPLEMPIVHEYNLFARHTLLPQLWLELDLVYRRISRLPHATESNRLWNPSRTRLVGYRTGRAETIIDTSSEDDLERRYAGGTVALGARVAGLRGLVAYTYAHQVHRFPVDLIQGERSVFADPDPEARRHGWRLVTTYDLHGAAAFGLVYRYDSGLAPPGRATGDPLAPFDPYRGQRGLDPRLNVNQGTDLELPWGPSRQSVDLQARLRLERWTPVRADFYAEVLNAFNQGKVHRDPPIWFRVGMELRY